MNAKEYKPMLCPICREFAFSSLQEEEMENEDLFLQCMMCGWVYDRFQAEHPDEAGGVNALSCKDYRKQFRQKRKENPTYHYASATYLAGPHVCPVCKKHRFPDDSSFEICPYCGWQDDGVMEEEPDKWAGCANDLCLNDFRKRYQHYIQQKANYKYKTDGFLDA